MDEGEAATERISDDSEEIETVLTSMDAATVLASGVIDVPTSSGSIPTASTHAEGSVPTSSEEVPTASPVFATATMVTPVTRRKGKEVMVESETLKKQKVQEQIDAQVARELEEQLERDDQRRAEQIAKDVEVAWIHVEEELQSMIDGLDSNNETIAKYLQEYRQFSSELPIERRVEMISLKEEVERIKRKGINLEQESGKKQKTSKEATEEAKPLEEVTKEKDKEIFMLVEKDYPLRKGLALGMICYKLQVENFLQMGRIVGNKMHKTFPLLVIEFPLAKQLPIASEERCHC
nr:hypothetical protein [Tanacetum cinerariifolium]